MKILTLLNILVLSSSSLGAQEEPYDTIWVNKYNTRIDSMISAGNMAQLTALAREGMAEAKTRFGPESSEFLYMMSNLGDFQKGTGDSNGAEQTFSTLYEICQRKYASAPNLRMAHTMSQLGYLRFKLGKNETAEPLLTGSGKMFDALGLHMSHYYANINSSLAAVYQAQGYFLKAEQLHLEALDIEKNLAPPNYDAGTYGACANNLAVFYSAQQRHEEALRYYDISLQAKDTYMPKKHPFYFITVKNKGRALTQAGRYAEAEVLLKNALDTARAVFPPGNPQLYGYLLGLALHYEKTGNYPEAIHLEEEGLTLLKNSTGPMNPDYNNGLITLASMYRAAGRLGAADTLLREAIQLAEQTQRTQTLTYANALIQSGKVFQALQRYGEARPLLEKGNAVAGKILGADHPAFYENCGEALVQQDLLEGRPDSALRRLDRMRGPILTAYGERHERFISLETQYGAAWRLKGDAGQALQHFRAAFGALQQNLAEHFAFFSVAEREKFARTFENYRNAALAAARAFPGDESFRAFLYDLTLFQKELLASYDRQLLAGWQQNSDGTYHDYVETRRMIARQWTLPANERLDLPELETRRAGLEKKLALSAASSSGALHSATWQQVQKALQTGDAAVEWLILPPAGESREAPCYAALVLRPGPAAPDLLLLPDAARIDALFASKGSRGLQYATRTYTGTALYRSIWQPLDRALSGVQRIFYAPAGALHLLNFDALQASDGSLLCEKYRLVRLANTAGILDAGFGEKLSAPADALLAGGLDYESTAASSAVETALPAGDKLATWRGGSGPVREWTPLPNTLPEVERLAALLREKNVEATLLTGSAGGETNVKQHCTGRAPALLHFATHGFFFEKNTAAPGSLGLVAAENPMYRSGLILAGANPAWRGQPGSGMPDDGILTADEISLLPLRNTALTVLSACETGLGDVDDDEGVYGLQRAFRLAGARRIVMSLWRVPDEQTRLFMEKFYAALLENGDVRQAFQSARIAMRTAFGNPYYWAGFVLLE